MIRDLELAMDTESERAFEAISSYLSKNRLQIGDSLPGEMEWVSLLGVGRSTVREALSALKTLGVIRSRRRGGITVVRNPQVLELRQYFSPVYASRDVFLDACEFRSILERGMSDIIFEQTSSETLREIELFLDEQRVRSGEVISVWDCERRFHRLLIRDCRNRLASLLASLYDPIFEYAKEHREFDSSESATSWLPDHEELFGHLVRRDRSGFTICLHRHTRLYLRTHEDNND
jgi:DNA-binding FadR family transcriptional regulator